MIEIDRRDFIAGLGGAAAVSMMSHEARADAIEEHLNGRLELAQAENPLTATGPFPTAAEVYDQITTRSYRRGVGMSMLNTDGSLVQHLPAMPKAPTLVDYFELRFANTRNHCYQSAQHALNNGVDEEIVLACLLHDVVQEMIRTDHGYWGAQLFEPYVPERTAFAIKYHQALRFFDDDEAGYSYPDLYHRLFGLDYVPPPHIQQAYEFARNHRWYDAPRTVTVNDLYSFDDTAEVSIEPFIDIIGRHFKQPKAGLGNDGSPVAHMWRTLADPDAPL